MKELTNINFRRYKWRLPALIALLVVVVAGSFWLNTAPFRSGFEITDELGGNIFPSSILSVATTDAQVIVPADSLYVGNSKSCISIRIRKGVQHKPIGASALLRRNLLIYGLGGVIAPFIGIKLIDMIVSLFFQ